MAELTSMPNIGQEMARKLAAVGIGSAEVLRTFGTKMMGSHIDKSRFFQYDKSNHSQLLGARHALF